jgi:hypothetical protein
MSSPKYTRRGPVLCLSAMAAQIRRVGQNRIYIPYMTVYFVISLPKIPYINRIYMVLANPTDRCLGMAENLC